MLKSDFVAALAQRYNISDREAQKWLSAVLDSLEDALSLDGKANLRGLGYFKVVEARERKGTNLQTGEAIVIPARRAVRFGAAPSLLSLLNDPLYDSIQKNKSDS